MSVSRIIEPFPMIQHGITLCNDIRNIQVHDGLLDESCTINGNYVQSDKSKEVEIFTIVTEAKRRTYDKLRLQFGMKLASNAKKGDEVILQDIRENTVTIHSPYKNDMACALVKYTYVKVLEGNVEASKLKLSNSVLDNLKEIDRLVSSDKRDSAKKYAEDFMMRNGSHTHCGDMYKGGIFEWMITWETDTDVEDQRIEKLARELLVKYEHANASSTGIWYHTNEDLGRNGQQQLVRFKIRATKLGGSSAIECCEEFEKQVSDGKGVTLAEGELVPVWDIIEHQDAGIFENTDKLKDVLQSTWKENVVCRNISAWDELIDKMGLLPYQDEGISHEKSRTFTLLDSNSYTDELAEIPWIILEKLLRMDHRCNDLSTISHIVRKHKKDIPQSITFHPMDILLIIYHSSDIILRQVLVKKMFMTRLAIPFIYQSPSSNRIEFSLWPLRPVALQWLESEGKSHEVSLVNHPLKTVSFIRFGDNALSKSSVLNYVVSSPKSGTFFTRESSGGKRRRCVSSGMIEMTCCLPKDGSGHFAEELMFLNLRGDGSSFSKQCLLLSCLSTLVVCFIDISKEIDDSKYVQLRELQDRCANVIVLLTREKDGELSTTEEDIVQNIKQKGLVSVNAFDAEGDMNNTIDVADDLVVAIQSVLPKVKSVSINDQLQTFRDNGVVLDEDNDSVFHQADTDVNTITNILSSKDFVDIKKELLPLQGPELKQWVQCLKKKHKGLKTLKKEDAMERNEKIAVEMKKFRKRQFEQVQQTSSLVRQLIGFLKSKTSNKERAVFLRMLSISVDNMARNVIPQMRQNYLNAWQKRQKAPGKFLEAAKMLDESSFGTENLFREIGQLYECMTEFYVDLTTDQLNVWLCLADVSTSFFLSGQPLEIMNGDTGAVPLVWIMAILDSLHKAIGDKKMFVLSVIGVQSSGKSTLLNTMFGIELAVGAGRCTRGVYAQLLDVDRTRSPLPVDYILVLDSEGLCSTSTDNSQMRDSEIATLVIGLADITLVNVKGENSQQMKESFEVVVPAFLRMQCVNEYKRQKCFFLHQSVSAADAKEQLMVERMCLKEHLDKITREAAEAENVSGYIKTFNDIIDFDVDKDVFYIPDLWVGSPPLAQVSTGYSEGIRRVRDVILQVIKNSVSCTTANDMKIRLEDMWSGILADDFLFSYKNNLSTKAYLELERQFYGLVRDTESKLIEYQNNVARIEIEKCESVASVIRCQESMKQKMDQFQKECIIESVRKLSSFFTSSDLREHLSPWRQIKKRALEDHVKEMVKKINNDLKYYTDCKKIELEKVGSGKSIILQSIQQLVRECKGKNYSHQELMCRFTERFDKWRDDLHLENTAELHDVGKGTKEALQSLIQREGLNDSVTLWSNQTVSMKDMNSNYIELLERKQEKRDERETKLHSVSGSDSVQAQLSRLRSITNGILEHVKKELNTMMTTSLKFSPEQAKGIFEGVWQQVNDHNVNQSEHYGFKLSKTFISDVLQNTSEIAKVVFLKMNSRFEQILSINQKVEDFDTELREMFIKSVADQLEDGAVQFLCVKIKDHIKMNIFHDMNRRSVDKILKDMQYSKSYLLTSVMKDLAEQPESTASASYMEFVSDVYGFCCLWIEKYSRKSLFDPVGGTSEYAMFTSKYMEDTMPMIQRGVRDSFTSLEGANNENIMVDFIRKLKESISTIVPFTDGDCSVIIWNSACDFQSFHQKLQENITKIKDDLMEMATGACADTVDWVGESPYKQVIDRLWGCQASCPFCLSPCVFTDAKHVILNQKHECLQHWPLGLRGTRWRDSCQLMTDVCNFTVTTGSDFNCTACNYACCESEECSGGPGNVSFHPMRQYKTFLKGWEIEADIDSKATKYWQWVMATYKRQLSDHHGADAPNIPTDWNKSKSEAIKSLFKYGMETTPHDFHTLSAE